MLVVLRPAAAAEYEDALAWYGRHGDDLAADFAARIDAALRRIAEEPLAHPRVHDEVRRALIRRFPYGIFYLVESNRVVVLAVFHASRDPAIWQGRR